MFDAPTFLHRAAAASAGVVSSVAFAPVRYVASDSQHIGIIEFRVSIYRVRNARVTFSEKVFRSAFFCLRGEIYSDSVVIVVQNQLFRIEIMLRFIIVLLF